MSASTTRRHVDYTENDLDTLEVRNSLLESLLSNVATLHGPQPDVIKNLSSISALYIYTNPAPLGLGSQAPKVAESVLRTRLCNKKKEVLWNFEGLNVHKSYWEKDDGNFPWNEISCNWVAYNLRGMSEKYLKQFHGIIDQTAEKVITSLMVTNSDILTKGRQTWCPLTYKSCPSAIAFRNASNFLTANGSPKALTVFEFIGEFGKLFQRDEIKGFKMYRYQVTKVRRNKSGLRITTKKNKIKMKSHTYFGSEVQKYLYGLVTSFCSYLKHLERGKLEKRAIASANVFLRMYLMVVEEFHLELGKLLPGSTISIGGEEKQAKLINSMNQNKAPVEAIYKIQWTEDATRWNECINCDSLAFFHFIWFDDETRRRLNIPLITPKIKLLRRIIAECMIFVGMKKIVLGHGPIGYSDLSYNMIEHKKENLHRFNKQTREWVEQVLPHLDDEGYVFSPGGMLMGIFNAASTTYGLLHENYGMPETSHTTILRSSDDSMTLMCDVTKESLFLSIYSFLGMEKSMGINKSEAKTVIFPEKFGEFTSKYQDGNFVSQFGTETASLRPTGKNPSDDFYNIAKNASIAQQRLEINPLGASAYILLGIENVRRLYRIQVTPEKRPGIGEFSLMLADGGRNPWNAMMCHLDEATLKSFLSKQPSEIKYLYKICNPDNPFSVRPEEQMTYSKETSSIITDVVETPRNIFNYIRRSNRTALNIRKDKSLTIETEKNNQIAVDILEAADITTFLKRPTQRTNMADHVYACLSVSASICELSCNEKQDLENALSKLSGISDSLEPELEISSTDSEISL